MKKSLLNLCTLCLLAGFAAALTACSEDKASGKCTEAEIARAKPGCFGGSLTGGNNNNGGSNMNGGTPIGNNNVPPVDTPPPVDSDAGTVPIPGTDGGPGRGPGGNDGGTPSGACADIQPEYGASGEPATPCAAATKTCVAACDATNSDCINTCLANESDECFTCINTQYGVCPQYQGCGTQYGAASCCYEANCANSTDENCFASKCATENNAYSACYSTPAVSNLCDVITSSYFDVCYGGGSTPTPGSDAGPGGSTGNLCSDPFDPLPNGYTFCTASTKTCLHSCAAGDFTCINDCVDSDTAAGIPTRSGGSVDCGYCLGYTEQVCASKKGCSQQFADYNCCIEDNNCTDSACVNLNCKTQYNAFISCIPTSGCTDDYSNGDYSVCFM